MATRRIVVLLVVPLVPCFRESYPHFGGLVAGGLEAGEMVIVCFATGRFGSAAIDAALTMRAGHVVAARRNIEALKGVRSTFGEVRVSVVVITGDHVEDGKALRAAVPHGAGVDCLRISLN